MIRMVALKSGYNPPLQKSDVYTVMGITFLIK